MAQVSSTVTVTEPLGPDPLECDEFAYRIGHPDGMLVLRYQSGGALQFGTCRQDFLHQIYWSPDGLLAAERGSRTWYVGGEEALWVRRAVTHDVRAYGLMDAYRICLREVPDALGALTYGPVTLDEAARAELLACTDGAADVVGARTREALMRGVNRAGADTRIPLSRGRGYAAAVAQHLAYDPGDPASLADWASHLHVSSKTLQRDFQDTFDASFSEWRTDQRLHLARSLLQTDSVSRVASHVGYASASAFVHAFRRRFGHTPGEIRASAQ